MSPLLGTVIRHLFEGQRWMSARLIRNPQVPFDNGLESALLWRNWELGTGRLRHLGGLLCIRWAGVQPLSVYAKINEEKVTLKYPVALLLNKVARIWPPLASSSFSPMIVRHSVYFAMASLYRLPLKKVLPSSLMRSTSRIRRRSLRAEICSGSRRRADCADWIAFGRRLVRKRRRALMLWRSGDCWEAWSASLIWEVLH